MPGEPGNVSVCDEQVPSTSKAGMEDNELFLSESDSYNDDSDRDSDFCILKEFNRKDISSGEDELLETLGRTRKRCKLQMKVPVAASPSIGTYVCRIMHGNCEHPFFY